MYVRNNAEAHPIASNPANNICPTHDIESGAAFRVLPKVKKLRSLVAWRIYCFVLPHVAQTRGFHVKKVIRYCLEGVARGPSLRSVEAGRLYSPTSKPP